jgi:hypothetical protein
MKHYSTGQLKVHADTVQTVRSTLLARKFEIQIHSAAQNGR